MPMKDSMVYVFCIFISEILMDHTNQDCCMVDNVVEVFKKFNDAYDFLLCDEIV